MRTAVVKREHNRGRLEIRALECQQVTPSQVGFPGARLAARLETRVKRHGKWHREVIYLLSSLTLEELQAQGILCLKRARKIPRPRVTPAVSKNVSARLAAAASDSTR